MSGLRALNGRAGAGVSALALFALVCLFVSTYAQAFAPVGYGVARQLAPGLLRTLATATETSASIVGSRAALRVTTTTGANIGGMGASVVLSREAPRSSIAKALAGLAGAAGVASVLDDALDSVDCDLGLSGFRCAGVTPRTNTIVRMWSHATCANADPLASGFVFPSRAAALANLEATCSNPGAGLRREFRVSAIGGGLMDEGNFEFRVVNISSGASDPWQLRGYTSREENQLACRAGQEPSRFEANGCRSADVQSWPEVSPAAVEARLASRDSWLSIPLARALGQAGAEIPDAEAPTRVESAPSPIALPYTRRSWTLDDGSVVSEELRPEYITTPDGDLIRWRLVENRTVAPPGSVVPGRAPDRQEVIAPGAAPGVTPGEVLPGGGAAPAPAEQEDIECGLPGRPPCKIDETGTPTAFSPLPDPDTWVPQVIPALQNPDIAEVTWSWAFTLPSTCSAMNVDLVLIQVDLDLCRYQPMIHEIMSLIWIATGIWFAVSMVGRTLTST